MMKCWICIHLNALTCKWIMTFTSSVKDANYPNSSTKIFYYTGYGGKKKGDDLYFPAVQSWQESNPTRSLSHWRGTLFSRKTFFNSPTNSRVQSWSHKGTHLDSFLWMLCVYIISLRVVFKIRGKYCSKMTFQGIENNILDEIITEN